MKEENNSMKFDDEDNLVAVYGSLRKGMGNHNLLAESNFLGQDSLKGFKMISLVGYPALFESEEKDVVKVEVYSASKNRMNRLDMLEGFPSIYNRKKIETKYGSAWIYYFDREMTGRETIVESGDWVEYNGGLNQ